ncbi:MAG: hypothetical protein AB9891_18355 [Anaerolineaceae bacterium]
MNQKSTFDIVLLTGRPGSGKSEVIDYLKRTPLDERLRRFHIGKFEEIDDFPMLWTWFEEDALLEEMGFPRLHSDQDGYFIGRHLWDLLIRRIGLDYLKKVKMYPDYASEYTTILEFSRGSEHGGYRSAFNHLPPEIVEKLAVLYIDVSWEESLRKNRKRFNPNNPGSILEHSLPDAKLERLYKESDWQEVRGQDADFLHIQGYRVPYLAFDNSDDLTTSRGAALGNRLEKTLGKLWQLTTQSRP